jgi:hypothetical protein
MKSLLFVSILSLGACALFQKKPDTGGGGAVQRETFYQCEGATDADVIAACGHKSGGICKPSMEHHSTADKCPRL